jgi:TonB-dependent receptor
MQKPNTKPNALFIAITLAGLGMSQAAIAQEKTDETNSDSTQVTLPAIEAPVVEEMLILGRQQSAAQSVMTERLEQPFAADLMSDVQIGRTGDTNVALALTRVTGVTLLDGKYVYVRSLGERYSSVTLNGAAVPSPELTRNVLPLDLIPSSIVKTLKVQKAYSPELPGHFGGGSVDIRTKTVPEELLFNVSLGVGTNSESDDGLSYGSHGETNEMPVEILNALDSYQGNLSVENIKTFYQRANPGVSATTATTFAENTNRNLMLGLNRDVQPKKRGLPADYSNAVGIGNSWDLTDDFVVGGVLNFSQDSKWRNKDQTRRNIGSPDTAFSETERTTEETRQVLSANLGVTFQQQHKLQAGGYYIENIHDQASIKTGFDGSNYSLDKGVQYVNYDARLEQRKLEVGQVLGEHEFDQFNGDTLDTIVIDWFYSDAKATTDIPNHATVKGDNNIDPASGNFISTQLSPAAAMATFEFLTLEDKVESYGWNAKLPLNFDSLELVFSGGYSYNNKVREYYGYNVNINATGITSQTLQGNIDTVLTNGNLTNLNNNFELDVGGGFGTESYVAAQITEAGYGMFDATWNETWRVTGGARMETFRQAVLPIDLLDYTGQSLVEVINGLQDPDQTYAIQDESWQPSLALTYMNEGFMDAEVFQLRLSGSQTLVRPDLREMSDVVYIDTELGMKVKGNSGLVFSDINHYDLRAEWFFDDGNNFTASLFYKDIKNPIESTRLPGSDDDVILSFENSESGEIYGLELEMLRDLGAGFFTTTNLTLSDSEIVSAEGLGYTNSKRPMTGQSEYVLNAQLGYDSENGQHSVSLVYNLFGERLFFAARNIGQNQDAFEQPFNSLDLTYSWFPTDSVSTKVKLANLLDEERIFKQENSNGQNVEILTQQVGVSASVEMKYSF